MTGVSFSLVVDKGLALDKGKEDIPDGVYGGNTSLEPEICVVHCLEAVERRDVGRGARRPGTKCCSEPSVTAFADSATKRERWDFRRSES